MTTIPDKKRFTLYAPSPTRNESRITFEGCEWVDLEQASASITGNYGHKIAMKILERSFVLTTEEALGISAHHLPFTLGFYDGANYFELPVNLSQSKEHLRWIDEPEEPHSCGDKNDPASGENKCLISTKYFGILQTYRDNVYKEYDEHQWEMDVLKDRVKQCLLILCPSEKISHSDNMEWLLDMLNHWIIFYDRLPNHAVNHELYASLLEKGCIALSADDEEVVHEVFESLSE